MSNVSKEQANAEAKIVMRVALYLSLAVFLFAVVAVVPLVVLVPQILAFDTLLSLLAAILLQALIYFAVAHFFLYKWLFKPHKKAFLRPSITREEFKPYVLQWAAMALGFGLVLSILLSFFVAGGANAPAALAASMVATWLTVRRLTKQGKAHLEILN